jgi:hypothetical protein
MFPNLARPRKQDRGEPKYGVLVLLHKDSEELKMLVAAVKESAEAGGVKLVGRFNPVKSCKIEDQKRALEGKESLFAKLDDAEDFFFFNAQNTDKPGMVDTHIRPQLDLSVFKSGCYVRVNVNAYVWSYGNDTGVSIGLNHVQFVQEGPSLNTGTNQGAGTPVEAFTGLGGKVDKASATSQSVEDLFG